MSMNPADFHDLLDSAVATAPTGSTLEEDLAVARRRLRRRRRLASVGAAAIVAATVVVVAGVASVTGPDGDRGVDSTRTDMAASTAGSEALLTSCRTGNQSEKATDAIFGSGVPIVKAVSRTDHQIEAALESGDGRHWAECWVHLDNAEFASGMTVYDATGTTTDTSSSYGPGCGLVDDRLDTTCRSFFATWVDRRPAEVAAAEFLMGDGRTVTVASSDGYLVLNYLATMPDGETIGGDMSPSFPAIRRITFLDASGDPIAAEAQDGSGSGPDGERVGDLPSITAFPALRSAREIY